jgi:FtsP/CotA-like multicopper oxidase with cupredoxin domain
MKKLVVHIFLLVALAAHAQQPKIVYMAAEMNELHYLDDFSTVEMWGYGIVKPSGAYSASLPGPVLEFNLGDTVEIHFKNTTPEDHTIHLHGLDVSMMEDGVPMTSMAVDPNDSIIYNFVANNPGTFLYHCHVLTTLHLMMGMYGVIVVHSYPDSNRIFPGGPSFQKEHVFLASDMDKSVNGNPLSPGPFHEFTMDYFMINGLAGNQLLTSTDNQVTAYPGDSVLLRLGSMAYSKTRFIFPPEVNAVAWSSDGRVLPSPMNCDTLIVYPGERYDVLLVPDAITDVNISVDYYASRNDQLQYTNYIELNGDAGINTNETGALFTIYPNPANNEFMLVTETMNASLFIYDISGKVVGRYFVSQPSITIDISDLETGLYILKYGDQVQKLVKR